VSDDYQPLTTFVKDLRATARRIGILPEDDVRLAASVVTTACYGQARMLAAPGLVNIAALALTLEQLIAHQLRPEVPEVVHATDIHTLPSEPPRLLRRAWILEARGGHALFGDTTSLGGYALGEVVYLVGLQLGGSCLVGRWTPHWSADETELAEGITLESSPLIGDVEAHEEWTREAARFALVFGLLLDAEGAPTRITDESDRSKRRPPGRSKKQKPPPAWVTRYVDLVRPASVEAGERALPAGLEPGAAITGREALQTEVRGHLKRQPHGPGGSLRKLVWVPTYGARRWVAPRPHRVVVSAGEARPR
jgi:hypothetical protein